MTKHRPPFGKLGAVIPNWTPHLPLNREDTLIIDTVILNLAVALGIGLLIGAERERRKGEGPSRSPAGIRTFTVTSLAGAVSIIVSGEVLLAVTTAGVIILTAVGLLACARRRSWSNDRNRTDPDHPTWRAIDPTARAGSRPRGYRCCSARSPVLAPPLRPLGAHRRRTKDALIFAGTTLVVLPLVPDRPMGPYGAINPHSIWVLVILVMAISAAGYIAVRLLGAKFGLPIAGLASGFISSTATIGAMGARAAKTPDVLAAAVAGAVLSTIATIVQMALVLAATSMTTLRALSVPLICAGLAAVVYGAVFTVWALQQKTESEAQSGRAFSLSTALVFALTLSSILVASAALQEWFGETGVIVAAALAGFVDTHSAAISVASLVASGKMNAADGVFPILAGLSTNTISKMFLAGTSGGRSFALRVIPGLIVVALAAWGARWPF